MLEGTKWYRHQLTHAPLQSNSTLFVYTCVVEPSKQWLGATAHLGNNSMLSCTAALIGLLALQCDLAKGRRTCGCGIRSVSKLEGLPTLTVYPVVCALAGVLLCKW